MSDPVSDHTLTFGQYFDCEDAPLQECLGAVRDVLSVPQRLDAFLPWEIEFEGEFPLLSFCRNRRGSRDDFVRFGYQIISGWLAFFFGEKRYRLHESQEDCRRLKGWWSWLRRDSDALLFRLLRAVHYVYSRRYERGGYRAVEQPYYRVLVRVRADIENMISQYFQGGGLLDILVTINDLGPLSGFDSPLVRDIGSIIQMNRLFRGAVDRYDLAAASREFPWKYYFNKYTQLRATVT